MKEKLLIGGTWVDGAGGDRIDVTNPANGDGIYEFCETQYIAASW